MTIKQLEPSARTALICGGAVLVTGEQCAKVGAEALHCNIKQMGHPLLVGDCRTHGVKVRPWTVNDEADFRAAVELKIDAVITNRVDDAVRVIRGG
jgi:glycerophosphoryl diester phosphodiesterase